MYSSFITHIALTASHLDTNHSRDQQELKIRTTGQGLVEKMKVKLNNIGT